MPEAETKRPQVSAESKQTERCTYTLTLLRLYSGTMWALYTVQ